MRKLIIFSVFQIHLICVQLSTICGFSSSSQNTTGTTTPCNPTLKKSVCAFNICCILSNPQIYHFACAVSSFSLHPQPHPQMCCKLSHYETHTDCFSFLESTSSVSQAGIKTHRHSFIQIHFYLWRCSAKVWEEAPNCRRCTGSRIKVGQESLFDKLNCLNHSLKHSVGQQQSLASPPALSWNEEDNCRYFFLPLPLLPVRAVS